MLYREAGDFKTSYPSDSQTFPIRLDRYGYYALLAVAIGVVPFIINDYWANAIVVPFLIYTIAALGLNILIGYCGQLSLRIKGFYLAVATLAAQFFLIWLFTRTGWFFNHSPTGMISAPERTVFGLAVTGPRATAVSAYLICLAFLIALAWLARNLTRGTLGRKWMAIRDMDIAAEIIGVNPLRAKLSAFAVSSFFIGIAGALFFAVYLGAAEAGEAFGIDKSFLVLFMVIIGGLGSIMGSFLGGAFLVIGPVMLKLLLVNQLGWSSDLAAHLEIMIIGALIIVFLILEPHGLTALWRTIKEKLRLWPFPY
ncbi:MAG: branched-chain amino acid ABC transporter permease [Gemmobacter sp.]